MSLKLTREGAYGYISVLIAKSPNLATLLNIIESGEVIDIQTAISRGILGSEYLVLLQAKSVDDIEDSLYNFYKRLLIEVAKFAPKPYDDYVDRFTEVFDLDKVISLIFSAKKQKLKHILSRIELLMNYILYSKKTGDDVSTYINCLGVGKEHTVLNTIECFVRAYIERVVSKLNNISELEPVNNSLNMFYEFSLLRLYRYVVGSKLLKIYSVKLEDIAKEMCVPAPLISKVVDVIKKLDDYLRKDLTLYTIYELKSTYDHLRFLLYTPHSFVDRLTYFLIHKFYEFMFVRYLAMYRYAWR